MARSTVPVRRFSLAGAATALLMLSGVGCGSDDDGAAATESSTTAAPDVTETTAATADTTPASTDTVTADTPSTAAETPPSTPTAPTGTADDTAAGEGGLPAVDPAALADAKDVLAEIAALSDDLEDNYDLGGGEGCPLLADFDGDWLAEAGGVLFCGSTDNTMSIGVSLPAPFAAVLTDGFELVGEDGPIRQWCQADACVVSWTDGEIDAFTFTVGSNDPSSAERYLRDHLVEVIDGVGTFDVEQIATS